MVSVRSVPGVRFGPSCLLLLLLVSILLASGVLPAQPVLLKDAFTSLNFTGAVDAQYPGDGTNRLFMVLQSGQIRVVVNDPSAATAETFLDIDSQVVSGGERGLLGLAFHPSYESNGYFFVNYTTGSPLRTIVSRFTVSPGNPDSADPASELVFLDIPQPYSNHNGGQLQFGPDGYLYVGMGDGGSGGDPENRAQNLDSLLGKILRIDVDTPSDTLNYSIPPDNPLAGNPDGYREEIFAWGLRNPWRFSFDPVGGMGWIADVGQGDWEEIDTMRSGGTNYGWRLKEGDHCYEPAGGCDTIPGLTDPVWEYAHDGAGGCSITGGYVYRGAAIPWLQGKYIYGDYCSGRIWALDTNGAGAWDDTLLIDSPYNILSFGIDREGEIVVCTPSEVYRLAAAYPPVPTLLEPPDGASGLATAVDLRWSASPGSSRYHVQAGTDPDFAPAALDDSTVTDTAAVYLTGGGTATHYWRVRAGNDDNWSPWAPVWSFTTFDSGATVYGVSGGWNIVCLPLEVSNGRKDSVFPTATSDAIAFDTDSGYLSRDSLVPGRGYWLKFGSAQSVPLAGAERTSDTVEVLPGWNLIGGISVPVSVSTVETEPPGILDSGFFGYSGSYKIASTLEPVKGYWVRVSSGGFIILP